MRCVSITVGGPKGEAVEEEDISRTVDSLISLSLPLGTRTTEITALNSKGEEVTIFSDGFFYDEEEEY